MTAILGKARHWTKLGWIAKNSLNKINLTKIGMSANCPFETVIRLFLRRWQMALRSNSIKSFDCPYMDSTSFTTYF
jgi:hypothetical protein